MNVLADVFRCPAGTVERAGVGGGKYCVTEPPGDSGSPPSPLLVSGDDGGGGGTLVAVVGTVILLILIACFVPGYGIQASKARQINNDERQKDESGLTATETTGEGDLKIDRMYPAGSSFSAKGSSTSLRHRIPCSPTSATTRYAGTPTRSRTARVLGQAGRAHTVRPVLSARVFVWAVSHLRSPATCFRSTPLTPRLFARL